MYPTQHNNKGKNVIRKNGGYSNETFLGDHEKLQKYSFKDLDSWKHSRSHKSLGYMNFHKKGA
jgi:hypothetical protein